MERTIKTLVEFLIIGLAGYLVYLAVTNFGAFLVVGFGCGLILFLFKCVARITR